MTILLPIILWGLVVFAGATYVIFRLSRRNLYVMTTKIPEKPTTSLIGNAYQLIENTTDIFESIKRTIDHCYENDGISKTWYGPRLTISIAEPVGAEIILNNEMNRSYVYSFISSWLGNGLISSPASIWKKHRKMLSPSFNQKILDGFIGIFAEQCNILIQKMSSEIGKGPFDIFKYVSPCTLDFICESAMGIKVGSQDKNNLSFVQAFISQTKIIHTRMFNVWLWPDYIFNFTKYKKQEIQNIKIMHNFTDNIIKKKCMEIKEEQKTSEKNIEYCELSSKRKAFLDSVLELRQNNKFTDVEVREEVGTMTIAGNDSTAHASCFILMILAYMQNVQEKVFEELREIYGDSNRPVVKEDLPKMQYLERVIKETLRLFPTIPIIARTLTQDIKLENYTIPAGCDVMVAVWGLHRDKKVWGGNANEFDPDRFLKENLAGRHSYSYIPFSGGPRNCFGKTYAMIALKSLVSTLLRAYKLRSDIDYRTMPLCAEILLKSVNGYMLTVEPRKIL